MRNHRIVVILAALLCLCLAAGTVACAPAVSLPTERTELPSASPVSDGAPYPFPGSGTADDPFRLCINCPASLHISHSGQRSHKCRIVL